MGRRVVFSAVLAAGLVQMAPAFAQQQDNPVDKGASPAEAASPPAAVAAAKPLPAAPVSEAAPRQPDLAEKDLAAVPPEELPPGIIDPSRARQGIANVKRPALPPRIIDREPGAVAVAERKPEPAAKIARAGSVSAEAAPVPVERVAEARPALRAGERSRQRDLRPDVALAERIVEQAQAEHGAGSVAAAGARQAAAPARAVRVAEAAARDAEMASVDEPSLQERVDAELRRERASAPPEPVRAARSAPVEPAPRVEPMRQAAAVPVEEPREVASAPVEQVREIAEPAVDAVEVASAPVEVAREVAAPVERVARMPALPSVGVPSVDIAASRPVYAEDDRDARAAPVEERGVDRRYDDRRDVLAEDARDPRDDIYREPRRDDRPVYAGDDGYGRRFDPREDPRYDDRVVEDARYDDRPYENGRRYAMGEGRYDERAEVSWPARNRYDTRTCDNARAFLLQQRLRREASRGLIDRRVARDIDAELVHLDDLHQSYCASGMNDWRQEQLERQLTEIEDRIRYEEERFSMR